MPRRAARRDGDRHVSVRQVAALKTFERAIVRRDSVASGPPTAEALLAGIPHAAANGDGARRHAARLEAFVARASDTAPSPAQRIAAQLARARRGAARASAPAANRRVSDAGRLRRRALDRSGALAAAGAGRRRPSIPAARFVVQCADIARAVATLARADGRMLAALAWRGTEVARVVAQWRPDQ